MSRSFDDPFRVVSWHPDVRILWRRSLHSFLDVYQAEILALVGWFADSHQYGEASPLIEALSLRAFSEVASRCTSSCSKSFLISSFSSFRSGQKRFPSGIVGLVSS